MLGCSWASPRGGLQPGEGFLTCPSLSHPQSSDNIPPGYEPISLLEALNGLRSVSPSIPSAPLYDEISYSGVVDGMPPASRPLVGMDRAVESSHQKGKRSKSPDRSAQGQRGLLFLPAPTACGHTYWELAGLWHWSCCWWHWYPAMSGSQRVLRPVRELGYHLCAQPAVTSSCPLRVGLEMAPFLVQLFPQLVFDIETWLDFSLPWSSPGPKEWEEKCPEFQRTKC